MLRRMERSHRKPRHNRFYLSSRLGRGHCLMSSVLQSLNHSFYAKICYFCALYRCALQISVDTDCVRISVFKESAAPQCMTTADGPHFNTPDWRVFGRALPLPSPGFEHVRDLWHPAEHALQMTGGFGPADAPRRPYRRVMRSALAQPRRSRSASRASICSISAFVSPLKSRIVTDAPFGPTAIDAVKRS
jgi:hypothetical protein